MSISDDPCFQITVLCAVLETLQRKKNEICCICTAGRDDHSSYLVSMPDSQGFCFIMHIQLQLIK